MSIIPPGHLPVAVLDGGERSEVLVPSDAPLASVLAELAVPAAAVVAARGMADAGTVLQGAVGDTVAVGETLGGAMFQGPACVDSASKRAIELSVVAGLDSGATRWLSPGNYRLGPGAVLHASTEAEGAAGTWAQAGGRTEVLALDGRSVAVADGDTPDLVAASPPIDLEPSREALFRRPPRAGAAGDVPPIEYPEVPPEPGAPAPLSWASLLAPLPIALAMAFFFRPLFALFGLMGPLLVLGRWCEQRRRRRKQAIARQGAVFLAVTAIEASRQDQAEAIAREIWTQYPHVAHLFARAKSRSVRIWERRSGDDDRLSVVVGVGPRLVAPTWKTSEPEAELGAQTTAPLRLRSVPHVVDLVDQPGVGFAGDVEAGRAVLRSVLLQLATLRGPADLAVVVVGRDLRAWEWVKWLPHLHGQLVVDPTDVAAWRSLGASGAVVVVDDPQADVASITEAATEAEVEVTVLSVAATAGELPAACALTRTVDADGWIGDAEFGAEEAPLGVGVTLATAVKWARALARVDDPEQAKREADERHVAPTLVQALNLDCAKDLERLRRQTRATSRAGAKRGDPGLPFVLGSQLGVGVTDRHGLARFDLVEDGPHALVAGTTGSGKSELLRTMVLSLAASLPPEALSFVLIDFKGGGAFDGCAELPHVAGFITDLDETLVERALAGLRAEVRAREERARRGDELHRLVVVIDEFAVLANDYPDVLDGLVDVAARGRSLGVHLVLATQKPSGVVDHRIRANTNLRIALRVQQAHESHDVVGVADAAFLDQRSPGRAIVRVGSDEASVVQVCRIHAVPASSGVAVTPFRLRPDDVSPARRLVVDGEQPLDQLARWISEASGEPVAGIWLPPLGERCSFAQLRQRQGPRLSGAYRIGIIDRPELREQGVYHWQPDRGGLAVFSGDPEPVEHLVGSAVAGVISGDGPADHAYVIGMSCPSWESHACVGAVVAAADRERVERLVALVEQRCARSVRTNDGTAAGLLLGIADVGAMLAGFDELERLTMIERLETMARTGPRLGLSLVLGARSVRDLPHRIAHHVPHRLLGRVADPTAHLLLGTAAPTGRSAMHVVDVDSGAAVLIGDRPQDGDTVAANMSVAPPVHRCPEVLAVSQLPAPTAVDGGFEVALGLRYRDLAPAQLLVRWGRDLLFAGPRGSGRTTALRVLAAQLERAGVRVASVGNAFSTGFDHLEDEQLAELAASTGDAEAAEPFVLLVDDVEQVDSSTETHLHKLLARPDRKVVIVVAATIDGARTPRSLAATVRAGGSGMLIGGSPLDGELFRLRRPDLPGLGQVPGRATLITQGRAESAHLAIQAHTA